MIRPFRDSDITVPIVWYPARKEDGTLPFPSAISSLDWATEPWIKSGVGEVYGADRKFKMKRPIPGPKRTHVCGTREEHGQGEVFDATRPPQKYLPSGLPTCCDPDRRESTPTVTMTIRSRAYTGPYSRPSVRTAVRSRTVRSDPYRSRPSVSVNAVSHTVRSEPYRSAPTISVNAVSLTERVDPYHSRPTVVVEVRSEWEDSQNCPRLSGACSGATSGPDGWNCPYLWTKPFQAHDVGLVGWRKWDTVTGEEYRLRLVFDSGLPMSGSWTLWSGDDCGSKVEVESWSYDEVPVDYTFTALGGAAWVSFDSPTFGQFAAVYYRLDPVT